MDASTPIELSRSRSGDASEPGILTTEIPARLERLPWGRFHTLVVAALGVTWILDGLEVTLAGSIAGALKASPTLRFSDADVGAAGTAYLLGAVSGSLLFGWLTDRLGRKKLFFITIAVYLTATALTGVSWNLSSFLAFRFLTGCGIGGENAAINSTIQEIVPSRYRGFVDLVINGSFWVGAALGAFSAIALLDPRVIDPETGWRLAFLVGAGLGVIVFVARMWIPESPRWLIIHGRAEEADRATTEIESRFLAAGVALPPIAAGAAMRLRSRTHTPIAEVLDTLFRRYRQRALVGLALMTAQAFFYNAIFFTYALVLTNFYAVSADHVGWHILPFAIGNFLGPVVLGRLFDTLGRRRMIGLTCLYCVTTPRARTGRGGGPHPTAGAMHSVGRRPKRHLATSSVCQVFVKCLSSFVKFSLVFAKFCQGNPNFPFVVLWDFNGLYPIWVSFCRFPLLPVRRGLSAKLSARCCRTSPANAYVASSQSEHNMNIHFWQGRNRRKKSGVGSSRFVGEPAISGRRRLGASTRAGEL